MDKGSSLPIKDFISLWYLLQRVGCSVQTSGSLFLLIRHLSFHTTGCSLVFSFIRVGILVFKRECFVLSARRVSFVQLCNLPYLTLQSALSYAAIWPILRCHLRHFMRWNASYCNVFWLILSANLLDFVRRFHFSKVLSSVFRLSLRHFSLGMNFTKWEHSGHRLWCKRQMRMMGVSLNGGPTCGSLLVNKS